MLLGFGFDPCVSDMIRMRVLTCFVAGVSDILMRVQADHGNAIFMLSLSVPGDRRVIIEKRVDGAFSGKSNSISADDNYQYKFERIMLPSLCLRISVYTVRRNLSCILRAQADVDVYLMPPKDRKDEA